jgi:dynein intermediate chain 2
MPPNMPKQSYIWNLNNPNKPEKTLDPTSPLCTLAFNHKNPDTIVGGSYNGSLQFFDVRQGRASGMIKPIATTLLEKSHHDPVYDIYWLTLGKSASECVSTSTDGRLLWWD